MMQRAPVAQTQLVSLADAAYLQPRSQRSSADAHAERAETADRCYLLAETAALPNATIVSSEQTRLTARQHTLLLEMSWPQGKREAEVHSQSFRGDQASVERDTRRANALAIVGSRSVTVSGAGNYSGDIAKPVTKLRAGKQYFVRIRTYKTVDTTTYYSKWSKKKSVTTK